MQPTITLPALQKCAITVHKLEINQLSSYFGSGNLFTATHCTALLLHEAGRSFYVDSFSVKLGLIKNKKNNLLSFMDIK